MWDTFLPLQVALFFSSLRLLTEADDNLCFPPSYFSIINLVQSWMLFVCSSLYNLVSCPISGILLVSSLEDLCRRYNYCGTSIKKRCYAIVSFHHITPWIHRTLFILTLKIQKEKLNNYWRLDHTWSYSVLLCFKQFLYSSILCAGNLSRSLSFSTDLTFSMSTVSSHLKTKHISWFLFLCVCNDMYNSVLFVCVLICFDIH